jgi:LacI family transcriptional regulator
MPLTPTQQADRRGETGERLRSEIRSQIESGRFAGGEFLPTVRELSRQYGVARKTVNRALKALETEGLVSAEPRQGYRVMARAGDPDKGCPIAFITKREASPAKWHRALRNMHLGLQSAAEKRGWSLLALGSAGKDVKAVIRHLGSARACGLILDAVEPDLLQAFRRAGLPVVVIDSWYEDVAVDTIIQDSYLGGLLAATHLVKRGHKRIAWFGGLDAEMHTMLRFSGFRSGLERAGLEYSPELAADAALGSHRENAFKLLKGRNRAEGIVALWNDAADGLVAAARELGLTPGRDFEMVGWTTTNELQADGIARFDGDSPQPAIVWSPTQMGELAIERLEALRRNPGLPPVRTSVPVELRVPEGGNAHG